MDGQGAQDGRRIPGPVPGSHARGRNGRPQEDLRRGQGHRHRLCQQQHHDLAAEGRQRLAADRRHRQAGDGRAGGVGDRRAGDADDARAADPANLRRGRGSRRGAGAARHARGTGASPRRRTSRLPRPTCSRTPKRHERRGHRGQQSAADGSPDRAALAADQGAAGVRHRLHLLLLLRQADLQRAGVAVRLDRRPGKFEVHLHRAAGIFPDPAEAGAVRRRLHLVPDRRRRRSTSSWRPASTSTSAAPSCRI